MLHEGITMRNARQKELLSNITDTQINFTSQVEEIQKYHTYSELSVSEATPGSGHLVAHKTCIRSPSGAYFPSHFKNAQQSLQSQIANPHV